MKEIIKTLLLEGIDEDTIHRVLDVIEEEYEVVGEGFNLDRSVRDSITKAVEYRDGEYEPKSRKYKSFLKKVLARGPRYSNDVRDKAVKVPAEKGDESKPYGIRSLNYVKTENPNPIKKQTNINKERDNRHPRHRSSYAYSYGDEFVDTEGEP